MLFAYISPKKTIVMSIVLVYRHNDSVSMGSVFYMSKKARNFLNKLVFLYTYRYTTHKYINFIFRRQSYDWT